VKRSYIESLGVYLPEKRLTTEELIAGCTIKPAFDLEGLTGIKERRVVGDNEYALDLAKKAIAKCLTVSCYSPHDIDMVICTNISRLNGPNLEVSFEPSSSFKLADHFGFSDAITFDVTSACAGMFIGILLMDSYIKAGMIKRGIVVSGEYITHTTRTAQKEIKNPIDPLFLSFTLGDSGAALVLDGTDDCGIGFHDMEFLTVARHCNLCSGGWVEKEYGGFVGIADSQKLMEFGRMLGGDLIGKKIKGTPWVEGKNHTVIFHQPARRPILKLAKTINEITGVQTVTEENLVIDVEQRGNTNSTSNIVALWDFILNGRIKSGDNILFGVQASGLTLGVATYTLDDLPSRILAQEQGS
jgi:3-oxoacyl-[acyl-carrier-protein] synthase III